MSDFQVLVREVNEVVDHPNADRLSLVKVLGYDCISAKNEDGSHRFSVGEPVIYIPEAAILPIPLLKERGFWNDEKDEGMLAGKGGTRVKAIRLRKVISQGLVFKTETSTDDDGNTLITIRNGDDILENVKVGDDVADFLGIEKYVPHVPSSLAGEVASAHEFALNFDIENEQNHPDFLADDEVVATEKLHGTCARIAYRVGVEHEELFGQDGNVAIASKGMGAKGLVFKNNEVNQSNLYVKTFLAMGLVDKIEELGSELNMSVDLFGEIFGRGVQDLGYGLQTPEFRAFDIAIDGVFLPEEEKVAMFVRLGVERVPVLYRGPWDRDKLNEVRDGKTMFGGVNVREGIVVTAIGPQEKREYVGNRLRPFVKMINPDYLTRKGETTEFN